MIRWAVIPALAVLAACAEPPAPQPQATAPAAPPSAPTTRVSMEAGEIRVKGPAPTEDDLEALHCAAAKRARAAGAPALEWMGGVARRLEDGFAADLVYETRQGPANVISDPAAGGAASVESWLIYCDQAGIPREGDA